MRPAPISVRRLSGRFGYMGAPAVTTAQGLQSAQQSLATILADAAAAQQQGQTWAQVSTATKQAQSELQDLVTGGILSSSDSASLLAQFQTSLASQWQAIQVSQEQPSSASLTPAAVATAAPTDTITLPILGTVSYTEAAIIGLAIAGGLWMLFGGKSGRR